MAGRIRSIKPEILEDAKTATLDDHSWRLFVSMFLLADDHGGLHLLSTKQIDGAVFWGTECESASTRESLARLARERLVTLYDVRGAGFAKITNWERHQKVDHPGKPRVPQPTDPQAIVFTTAEEFFARPSRDSRDTLAPDLRSGPATSDQERRLEKNSPAAPDEDAPPNRRQRSQPPEPSQDARDLAALLIQRIQAHTPEAVTDVSAASSRWARDIDLAIRVDGRDPHLLRQCIEFAQESPFWRSNVLSGKKLRAQVPTLVAQMRSGREAASKQGQQELLTRPPSMPSEIAVQRHSRDPREALDLVTIEREHAERGLPSPWIADDRRYTPWLLKKHGAPPGAAAGGAA